jgi:hypothetical protein
MTIRFFFLNINTRQEWFSNWKKMFLYLRQALLFLFLNFGHTEMPSADKFVAGLPDGLFWYQNSQFWLLLMAAGSEKFDMVPWFNFGLFGHLVIFYFKIV